MEQDYIARNSFDLAEEMLAETPITVISGARQTGKSTLLRKLIKDRNALFLNLDATINREAALNDPEGFIEQFREGLLAIDEIQRVPSLILAMKNSLEEDRRPGRFLVTGSSNLLALQGAEESLAGRAQTLTIDGFSQGELSNKKEDFAAYAWQIERNGIVSVGSLETRKEYLELATKSSYPEIYNASERRSNRWFSNYIERVLSKDVAEVAGIQHTDRLLPMLEILAANNASEFVIASYARMLDIPARSIPGYLKVLEDVYLIKRLPAWKTNIMKRTISKPKIIFRDTGLASYLTGADATGLELDLSSALTGGLVEGFVASELLKQKTWSTVDFSLGHFRDSQGREVDIVLENRKRQIVALEVKASTTVSRSDFNGLTYLRDQTQAQFVAGIVLHTGRDAVKFGEKLWALPIASLWSH